MENRPSTPTDTAFKPLLPSISTFPEPFHPDESPTPTNTAFNLPMPSVLMFPEPFNFDEPPNETNQWSLHTPIPADDDEWSLNTPIPADYDEWSLNVLPSLTRYVPDPTWHTKKSHRARLKRKRHSDIIQSKLLASFKPGEPLYTITDRVAYELPPRTEWDRFYTSFKMQCVTCGIYHPKTPQFFALAKVHDVATSAPGHENFTNNVKAGCLQCQRDGVIGIHPRAIIGGYYSTQNGDLTEAGQKAMDEAAEQNTVIQARWQKELEPGGSLETIEARKAYHLDPGTKWNDDFTALLLQCITCGIFKNKSPIDFPLGKRYQLTSFAPGNERYKNYPSGGCRECRYHKIKGTHPLVPTIQKQTNNNYRVHMPRTVEPVHQLEEKQNVPHDGLNALTRRKIVTLQAKFKKARSADGELATIDDCKRLKLRKNVQWNQDYTGFLRTCTKCHVTKEEYASFHWRSTIDSAPCGRDIFESECRACSRPTFSTHLDRIHSQHPHLRSSEWSDRFLRDDGQHYGYWSHYPMSNQLDTEFGMTAFRLDVAQGWTPTNTVLDIRELIVNTRNLPPMPNILEQVWCTLSDALVNPWAGRTEELQASAKENFNTRTGKVTGIPLGSDPTYASQCQDRSLWYNINHRIRTHYVSDITCQRDHDYPRTGTKALVDMKRRLLIPFARKYIDDQKTLCSLLHSPMTFGKGWNKFSLDRTANNRNQPHFLYNNGNPIIHPQTRLICRFLNNVHGWSRKQLLQVYLVQETIPEAARVIAQAELNTL